MSDRDLRLVPTGCCPACRQPLPTTTARRVCTACHHPIRLRERWCFVAGSARHLVCPEDLKPGAVVKAMLA